jgi:hypothetical protein
VQIEDEAAFPFSNSVGRISSTCDPVQSYKPSRVDLRICKPQRQESPGSSAKVELAESSIQLVLFFRNMTAHHRYNVTNISPTKHH